MAKARHVDLLKLRGEEMFSPHQEATARVLDALVGVERQ